MLWCGDPALHLPQILPKMPAKLVNSPNLSSEQKWHKHITVFRDRVAPEYPLTAPLVAPPKRKDRT